MSAKEIARGAEAIVYETRIAGIKVILKLRNPKAYRVAELDMQLRSSRTKKEAKIMSRALAHGIRVPMLVGVGRASICMEKVDGKLMKDVRISARTAASAGALLGALHNAGISHGDFTPANIIIEGSGRLCIIDFGLSEITSGPEEKALDILLMKRQLAKRLYSGFTRAYARTASRSAETLRRLEGVEERGRYQSRALE